MYLAQTKLQNYWFEPKERPSVDDIVGVYGVDAKKEKKLHEEVEKMIRKSKKWFVAGRTITMAEIDAKIQKRIDKARASKAKTK